MPELKPQKSEITDLNKHRKRKKTVAIPRPTDRIRPDLEAVPGVVVRVKDREEPITLINLPQRDSGADMVLRLIALHPDAWAKTIDDDYVRFGDIVRVDCPERGELIVAEVKKRTSAAPPGSYRDIQVKLSMRQAGVIGIFNIPDSPEGWELFREILDRYRSDRGGFPSGYTLYTTDFGVVPVHEFAAANPPP